MESTSGDTRFASLKEEEPLLTSEPSSKGDNNVTQRKSLSSPFDSYGGSEGSGKKKGKKGKLKNTSLLASLKVSLRPWKQMKADLRKDENSPFTANITREKQIVRARIRELMLEPGNHWAILTSLHGSVLPRVLPYCILEVIITLSIFYAKKHGTDLTFPAGGHHLLSLLVSFLVVTRVTITYGRFMQLRHYLGSCFKSCRDLVQLTCIITIRSNTFECVEWRRSVALKTIELLRVTVAAIEYKSSNLAAYDIVPDIIKKGVDVFVDEGIDAPVDENLIAWAHGKRTATDENWRAPIVCAYNLRCEIMKTRTSPILEKALHVNEELNLMGEVSNFVSAFHGLKQLITTPFPFPLVQMSRTLLFAWVFTIPFCLVRNIKSAWACSMISFLICYGFLGLEYVSIELDDPFGDDANDFDAKSMAQGVFEDLFITIYKSDGASSAEKLRRSVSVMITDDPFEAYTRENSFKDGNV